MTRRRHARGFDCIAFKRQAQAQIYEEIKGLSPEEEIAYFRRSAAVGPFGKLWKALGDRPETKARSEPSTLDPAREQIAIK